ncbi:MAG: hypothetical protein M3121_05255 [Chloroflexota bacterium]|nr:hypothetical protein [Chloroflexota bacterium]
MRPGGFRYQTPEIGEITDVPGVTGAQHESVAMRLQEEYRSAEAAHGDISGSLAPRG